MLFARLRIFMFRWSAPHIQPASQPASTHRIWLLSHSILSISHAIYCFLCFAMYSLRTTHNCRSIVCRIFLCWRYYMIYIHHRAYTVNCTDTYLLISLIHIFHSFIPSASNDPAEPLVNSCTNMYTQIHSSSSSSSTDVDSICSTEENTNHMKVKDTKW